MQVGLLACFPHLWIPCSSSDLVEMWYSFSSFLASPCCSLSGFEMLKSFFNRALAGTERLLLGHTWSHPVTNEHSLPGRSLGSGAGLSSASESSGSDGDFDPDGFAAWQATPHLLLSWQKGRNQKCPKQKSKQLWYQSIIWKKRLTWHPTSKPLRTCSTSWRCNSWRRWTPTSSSWRPRPSRLTSSLHSWQMG